MKTTIDITDILYKLADVSSVKSLINGSIYKDQLPDNSQNQDIVCSSTTIDGEMIQEGVGYINIHCPGKMPDHIKFKAITSEILSLSKNSFKTNEYSLRATNVLGPLKQEKEDKWYMSIRYRIRMYFNN